MQRRLKSGLYPQAHMGVTNYEPVRQMLQCDIYKVPKALTEEQSLQGEDVTFYVGS